MHYLFETNKTNLVDFFGQLSEEDIEECCEHKIFQRGEELYNDDFVMAVCYEPGQLKLNAIVEGSEAYDIDISLENGQVNASCTCPYDDVCKHVVATLFYCMLEDIDIRLTSQSIDKGNEVQEYLHNLSKEELIKLILKYAPEQFFIEIGNKFTDSTDSYSKFEKVKKNIDKLFNDYQLLHNPNDFEGAIETNLQKLAGLENHLKKEIGALIFHIMDEVEEAFDSGYLYDDYNDDFYEASGYFLEFVVNYVSNLPYQQKTDFLQKVDEAIKQHSYSTFESFARISQMVFTEDDMPELKKMLLNDLSKLSDSLVEKYYEQVSKLLSEKEKEEVLIKIQHQGKRLIELVNLYNSQNETQKALDVISVWLDKSSDYYYMEKVYLLYLDLLVKANVDLKQVAKEAISHCPTSSMLEKIASVNKTELVEFELILKQKNQTEFLNYLENQNRLAEALDLIQHSNSIWEDRLNKFYKKHKKVFPQESENYFVKVINNNLKDAGDRYYAAVAEGIKELEKINATLAAKILTDIRTNYKRRRNLISILSKF